MEHQWRVTVGGLSSTPASQDDTTSYRPPEVTAALGQGTSDAKTDGCEIVILEGDQFGPRTAIGEEVQEQCDQALSGVPRITNDSRQAGYMPMPRPHVTYWSRWAAEADPTGHSVYEARDCFVSAASTRITCRTAPGIGDELVWRVEIDGQENSDVGSFETNYHPPVITSYGGPGSSLARTEGSQDVIIDGRHFGPVGSSVAQAVYTMREVDEEYLRQVEAGNPVRRVLLERAVLASKARGHRRLEDEDLPPVFHATDCNVTVAHTQVHCQTVEGAGANLQWFLLIGNQISESPSTNYAPPNVDRVSGAGSFNASTEGEQSIVLHGRNFGHLTEYLDFVTYGPSGTEYVAKNCEVRNHTEIDCTTSPGVGRRMLWIVSVEGQESEADAGPITSYAAPEI